MHRNNLIKYYRTCVPMEIAISIAVTMINGLFSLSEEVVTNRIPKIIVANNQQTSMVKIHIPIRAKSFDPLDFRYVECSRVNALPHPYAMVTTKYNAILVFCSDTWAIFTKFPVMEAVKIEFNKMKPDVSTKPPTKQKMRPAFLLDTCRKNSTTGMVLSAGLFYFTLILLI